MATHPGTFLDLKPMKKHLLLIVLCLPGCVARTSPTPASSGSVIGIEASHVPPPIRVETTGLASLRAALPAPIASLALSRPLQELPAQTLTERQLSATIEGHLAAQQTRNRNWIVTTPPNGVAVTGASSSAGVLASAWNLPGDNNVEPVTMRTTFPRVAHAGDCLVLMSGAEAGGVSPLDEALAIVFVPYDVDLARVGALYCPSPVGAPSNPLVAFFRANPLPEALTDWSRLPSVVDIPSLYRPAGPIDPAGWGASPPTIEKSLPIFQRWAGDVIGAWWEAGRVPSANGHQGYGTSQAAATSDAMLLAVSTLPLEQRKPLVHALVQRGIDSLGAACAGRDRYPLGGHNVGWKPPVVLMGHMWGIPIFANPTPAIGPRWPEDRFCRVVWWWGGWDAAWPFSLTPGYDGAACALPPSQWGDPYAPDHGTVGWCYRYWTQAGAAQIGSITACHILGEDAAYSPWAYRWARQYMAGPPPEVDAQLRAVGIGAPAGGNAQPAWTPNWGHDYGGAIGFAAECWRRWGT